MAVAWTFYGAVVLLAVVRPFWGLVGLLASLLIRFQDRLPEIQSFPAFQLITAALVVGMFLNKNQVAKPILKNDKYIMYFIGFAVIGVIVMNASELIEQTIALMSSVLIYYFITRLVTNKTQLILLLMSISAVTIALAVESLSSFYADPITSPFSNPLTGRLQGLGYYANANEFGKLMCTAIPFVGIYLFKGNLIFRLAAVAAIGVMVLVIGETLSRTCFVVLAICIGSAIMLRGSGAVFRKAILVGVFGMVALIGATYLPGPLQERAQSILNYGSDKSFQGRVRAWDQGFLMVSWYPVFGVGKGQWYDYHGRAPHNSYVQVLAETGIPGFILFALIIFTSVRTFVEYLARPKEEQSPTLNKIGLAIAASYCGYLFYIFLGNQGYSPWTYFYFGLSGSFAYLIAQESGNETAETSKKSKYKRHQRPQEAQLSKQ